MRAGHAVLVVVTGVVVVGARLVLAQPATEITVDELVTRALADNPDRKAVRADVDAAVGRVRQAGLRPNPMLDLGGQKALSPDNNLTVGLSLPLDLNGRKEGRVAVAERELDMKRAQVAEVERRLRADVRAKAGELLAARRNLAVTDDLLTVNRDALGLVRSRVGQGASRSVDEGRQLVEVNRLEASRQMLASRVEITTLQLRALAGMAPDAPLILRGELRPGPLPTDRVEAARRALAGRPDLAVSRADVAAARARIQKEQAEGRWDATVNVGYQRQDFGFGLNGLTASGAARPIQDVFHYFGGGVSIVLPVRTRNEGNVAAATAEARAAERRQEFMTLMIRQEVDAAFTQYEATQRALGVFEHGVRDVAARNLDVVRQAYGLGRGTLLDVIAEQRRYIEIENGYTDVLKQTYDAAVEVGRGVGSPDAMPRMAGPGGGQDAAARGTNDEAVEVTLTPEAVERARIKTVVVRSGPAISTVAVPATVTSNAYRDTKVNSLVGGVVRVVSAELGAAVTRGQPLAVIFSAELAEAQMKYLSMRAMLQADHQKLERTEKLATLGAASRQELEEVAATHTGHETEVAAARPRPLLLRPSPPDISRRTGGPPGPSQVAVPAPIHGVAIPGTAKPG